MANLTKGNDVSLWKTLLFSKTVLNLSPAKKIAYTAMMTAISVVCNMFLEIKILDVQFSLTITVSVLIGICLGSVLGFVSCLIGDFIGFMINSGGSVFMFWVGLSTAVFAFISGAVFHGIKWKFKGNLYVKLSIICLLTFFVCTIGINTTGFYLYYKGLGFTGAFLDYASSVSGGKSGYFIYMAYRLFFKGQIYNSLVNYFLVFLTTVFLDKSGLLNKFSFSESDKPIEKTGTI